jgi:hypothetical protein
LIEVEANSKDDLEKYEKPRLINPILNIKRSDNPTESYRIPGDGITSESDGEIRSDYM